MRRIIWLQKEKCVGSSKQEVGDKAAIRKTNSWVGVNLAPKKQNSSSPLREGRVYHDLFATDRMERVQTLRKDLHSVQDRGTPSVP